MDQQGREAIISGIRVEAQSQADEIIKNAQKQIDDRRRAWQEQMKSQLQEAEREAARRAEAADRIAQSHRTLAKRRDLLKAREMLICELMREVQSDLAAMVKAPEYPAILKAWVVEAGVGLLIDEAIVQTSAQEAHYITDVLLREAEAAIHEVSGRAMRLVFDGATVLTAQGVLLVSRQGNIAYRNQVPVRMERYQSRIRHLIYEQLFKED